MASSLMVILQVLLFLVLVPICLFVNTTLRKATKQKTPENLIRGLGVVFIFIVAHS